jgi:hypothetical protein
MQERGDQDDADENEDFIRDGLPVNVGEAARLARDQRAVMICRTNCVPRHGFKQTYIGSPPQQVLLVLCPGIN